MPTPERISTRQLDLGAASYFEVKPETPASNQVTVEPGYLYSGGLDVKVQLAQQTSATFSGVASGGERRYDLVYVDSDGAVGIQSGDPGSPPYLTSDPQFSGAPGWTGTNPGDAVNDHIIPLAWITITETAGLVEVVAADISVISGLFKVSRDLDGYVIEKGNLGAAPTGSSNTGVGPPDVNAVMAGESATGTSTSAGVIVSTPSNVVDLLLYPSRDEIIHNTGARVYGRLTESGGDWTISYFYLDANGDQTAVADITTDVQGGAPGDILFAGVRKVYSRNDATRPLFASAHGTIVSDQIVGDIPTATTSIEGKVELSLADGTETSGGRAVQDSDVRVNTPLRAKNAADAFIGTRYSALRENGNITLTDLTGGVVGIAANAPTVVHYVSSLTGTTGAVGGYTDTFHRLLFNAGAGDKIDVGGVTQNATTGIFTLPSGKYRVTLYLSTASGVEVGIQVPGGDMGGAPPAWPGGFDAALETTLDNTGCASRVIDFTSDTTFDVVVRSGTAGDINQNVSSAVTIEKLNH